MQISPTNSLSFKSATVNINAFSDTHGNLRDIDLFYESLKKNKVKTMPKSAQQDVFIENDKKGKITFKNSDGNANILAVVGDWFMSGDTKGYLSRPEATSTDFQLRFLNKLIDKTATLAKGNLATLFVLGNHDFDGGEKLLNSSISDMKATAISTNIETDESPTFKENIDNGKLVKKVVVEVQDDKDKDLMHKVLFLGISPVNMQKYKKLEGVKLVDNIEKYQNDVTYEDYFTTVMYTDAIIRKFKKENPKGAVVLMSHTGVQFAENLREVNPFVDVILDAHEHRNDDEVTMNQTKKCMDVPIIRLDQNFNKYENIKIKFSDSGTIESIGFDKFEPRKENNKKGFFASFYQETFQKDLAHKYQIGTDSKELSELSFENVRRKNNHLANFITDAILSQIQKQDSSVQIFALNSSSIRNSIPLGEITNIDLIPILGGITPGEADIFTNEVSAGKLTEMLLDNYLFNEPNPEKNSIIHYSGLIVDKTELLREYKKGRCGKDLYPHIKLALINEPIKDGEIYKIANVEKYFKKAKKEFIKTGLYEKAVPLHLNAKKEFVNYFKEHNDGVAVKTDNRLT